MKTSKPNVIGERSVRVVSIGSMALSHLSHSRSWKVAAVFKRSFYCCDQRGNTICIGRQDIGNGPFTLLCSAENPWPEDLPTAASRLRVREKQLLLAGPGVTFDMQGALVWRKSLQEISGADAHLLHDISWVAEKAAGEAPPESIGTVVSECLPLNVWCGTSHASILTESLHSLFSEVISGARRCSLLLPGGQFNRACAGDLVRVMGLGPGLTPSGDDFLAGVVMGLFKAGRAAEAARLARYFYGAARGRTTMVSLAFYRALTEGLVAEPFHQFLAVLGTGDISELKRLMQCVSRFGGTSGWDTIAGIVFGVSLALSAVSERRDRADREVVAA